MIKYFARFSVTERLFWVGYVLSSIALFLYSFTQIDLGLVISRFPFLYSIEKAFQYVGYFNRPLSTVLFMILLFVFSSLYLFLYKAVVKKQISARALWSMILTLSIILFLSYNAFSYDIFNYIFDAKIVTRYHENPYVHKALDYPAEPMLSFMHWTHRTYPYGPIWLAVTVPLSYLGLQLFIPTFYLFKLLLLVSYLGTCFFIGRILRIISPSSDVKGIAFFALNPLVIFETLVSGHNDIFMMFLMVLSLYFLLERKQSFSILTFLLSIGVKFATVFLLPIYALLFFRQKKRTEQFWNVLMVGASALMFLAVLAASNRANFQPWYLIFVLPFMGLITKSERILYPVLLLSIVALGNYIPYLSIGTWTLLTMYQLFWVNSVVGSVGVIWIGAILIKTKMLYNS